MKYPTVKKGNIIMFYIEKKSGALLNSDGSLYMRQGDDYYKIFENIDQAKEYIKYLSKQQIEYALFNDQHNWIENIDK